MNLALGALAAALAIAPQPGGEAPRSELEYALPALRTPCLAAPCGAVLVTDLGFDLGEPGGPRAGEARLLVADRFYLGVSADEDTRTLSVSTTRWDLALDHQDRRTGLGAEYRGPRLRLRTRADGYAREAGDGWRIDVEAALRVGPDLELLVATLDDGRSGPGDGAALRPTSSLSMGALWQRGARFELAGRLVSETVATPGGLELDRRRLELDGVYQARRWRLEGGLALDDLSGRFDRREAVGEVRFDYRLTAQLVARGEVRERHELDLGSIERDLAAGLTYYARRFRFARGGAAARDTVALTRHARGLGFNERRVHDLEGRRRLRERLALSSARDDLAPWIERLHRAQVDERNVPVAGFSWRRDSDNLDGSRTREHELFLAVPWPRRGGPHPLLHDEAATDFLRFTYGQIEREISSGFATEGSVLAIDVSLRRELGLRVSWTDPAATGLQFALQTQERREFSAQLLYRRGI